MEPSWIARIVSSISVSLCRNSEISLCNCSAVTSLEGGRDMLMVLLALKPDSTRSSRPVKVKTAQNSIFLRKIAHQPPQRRGLLLDERRRSADLFFTSESGMLIQID